jgi:hypothetical protein
MSATPDSNRIGGTTSLSFTLQAVAGLGFEKLRILRPYQEWLVARQMALGRLAGLGVDRG